MVRAADLDWKQRTGRLPFTCKNDVFEHARIRRVRIDYPPVSSVSYLSYPRHRVGRPPGCRFIAS